MTFSPESEAPQTIVIDASLAVNAILPIEAAPVYLGFFEKWYAGDAALFGPALLLAEAGSAICQYLFRGLITLPEAQEAMRRLFDLQVEFVPLDEDLCQQALDWAARLGQSKIYDALYLALTKRLNAEFWTADRKLVRAAQEAGAAWVHWVGDG